MTSVVTFWHARNKYELWLGHGEMCGTLDMATGGDKMFGGNYTCLPSS